jgi:hypothetical protein
MSLAHGQRILKKDHVKLGALGRLSQLSVMGKIHASVGISLRVAPRCNMMTRRHAENSEPHFLAVRVRCH